MSRFLYLNIYSFLLAAAGILTLAAPFYFITKWSLVAQALISLYLFSMSGKLFSTWNDKKKEIDILVKRNQLAFRPDTFATFMQAPCGRLIVRQALRDLNRPNEYKSLKKLQKPLKERIRDNCIPTKTVVYINDKI